MKNPFFKEVLLSDINFIIGTLLLGSVALGAGLLMWQVAFDQNPLTKAFTAAVARETQN